MMTKLLILRTLIMAFIVCLVVWDGLQLVTGTLSNYPEPHKQFLLTAVLLLIASTFTGENSNDDDWAGQY